MKLLSLLLTLTFSMSALADPPPPPAPKNLPPKKVAVKKSPRVAAKPSNDKIPTQLPAYKGKKKVQVNFEENSGSHTTTVVVRQPLPLEQALEKSADEKIAAVERAMAPRPSPTPAPTPVAKVLAPEPPAKISVTPSPTPAAQLTKTATPSPALAPPQGWKEVAPAPIVEKPLVVVIDNRQDETPSIESTYLAKNRAHVQTAAAPFSTNINRFFARTAYLSAHYSGYEPALQDGATSIALGLSQQRGEIEGRLGVEVGHGLDQEITAQNTRYVLLRADASYLVWPNSSFTPFAGVGLGYGSVNLRSYRSQDQTTYTIREHMRASTLITTPAAGLRFAPAKDVAIDLTAEYLLFIGGGNSGDLGGLTGALSLALPF